MKKLTPKEVKWSEQVLISISFFKNPNIHKKFTIGTNTSDVGIEAVLSYNYVISRKVHMLPVEYTNQTLIRC